MQRVGGDARASRASGVAGRDGERGAPQGPWTRAEVGAGPRRDGPWAPSAPGPGRRRAVAFCCARTGGATARPPDEEHRDGARSAPARVRPRGAAQTGCGAVGSAPALGAGSRRFESGHPDGAVGPAPGGGSPARRAGPAPTGARRSAPAPGSSRCPVPFGSCPVSSCPCCCPVRSGPCPGRGRVGASEDAARVAAGRDASATMDPSARTRPGRRPAPRGHANVAQWQSPSPPNWLRGFDSRRSLVHGPPGRAPTGG